MEGFQRVNAWSVFYPYLRPNAQILGIFSICFVDSPTLVTLPPPNFQTNKFFKIYSNDLKFSQHHLQGPLRRHTKYDVTDITWDTLASI